MKKIVVLATGGTIAGASASVGDGVAYRAGEVPVSSLLAQVPGLEQLLGSCTLVAEQVAQVNSKDMDYGLWQALALRCVHWMAQDDVSGLVITHGTDTLEETAWFLQRMLDVAPLAQVLTTAQARKPVVLSSAMRPSTARLSDGPQNLADAVSVLQDTRARGVLAVEWLAACQGLDLRNGLKTSPALEKARGILRSKVAFYEKDRFFAPDINAASELLATRCLNELVPAKLLPSL